MCCVNHCVLYHTDLVSETHPLPDTIAFSVGESTHVWSAANAMFVKRVGGSENADTDVENLKIEIYEENYEKNSERSQLKL